MTFDSLTFARRLKTAGFTEAQAEALADANRDMLVPDLATRDDLTRETGLVRTDVNNGLAALRAETAATKNELLAVIETQTLRLTVRFGVMLAAGLSLMTAILGALLRFH